MEAGGPTEVVLEEELKAEEDDEIVDSTEDEVIAELEDPWTELELEALDELGGISDFEIVEVDAELDSDVADTELELEGIDEVDIEELCGTELELKEAELNPDDELDGISDFEIVEVGGNTLDSEVPRELELE